MYSNAVPYALCKSMVYTANKSVCIQNTWGPVLVMFFSTRPAYGPEYQPRHLLFLRILSAVLENTGGFHFEWESFL